MRSDADGEHAGIEARERGRGGRAPAGTVLLGDIGGTNARFALLEGGAAGAVQRFSVADHPTVEDAIATFLDTHCGAARPGGAVLAAAGPVDHGRCHLTNSDWIIDAARLKRSLGFRKTLVVNDFYTLAWSLVRLERGDLQAIGGGSPIAGKPAAVIGPGTGLGVSCLVPGPGGPVALDTEGGHVTLAAGCEREEAIIAHLRGQFAHVSAERALSGMGLRNLHAAIVALDGLAEPELSPEEIAARAQEGTCPVCREALDIFCALLGSFAGNAALIFGARGGVFIGGGIVPQMVGYLERSGFRERFEAKGRHSAYLAAVPTQVILHPDPAFLGLRALAEHVLET